MAGDRRVEEGRVLVIDYDPAWPVLFEAEQTRIRHVLGPNAVAVDHIGSTAVPGLGAKPTIDILVSLRRPEDARACIGPLAMIDYEYVPEYEKFLPDRRYFHKGPPLRRTYHLHMVERGSLVSERYLLFRDYLRADPEEAARYHALKKELADRFGADREGYTDAKTSFVEASLARARGERSKRP